MAESPPNRSDQTWATLRAWAKRYSWDMAEADALSFPNRLLLRVMDIGVWDDMLLLENTYPREYLQDLVRNAPRGALRPRSRSFWHCRLGLTKHGERPRHQRVRTTP